MTSMTTHWRALALVVATSAAAIAQAHPTAQPAAWIDPYRQPAARLIGESLSGSFAWERLAELGDTFGHRLSGSQALEDAIQWAVQQMKQDGLENVHTEPVKVPHWVRGQESAEIVAPRPAADGDARPRQQRRHARRTASRPRCSSSAASRSSTRPATRAARAGSSCSTSRSRPTARPCSSAPPVRRARRRSARSRCSSAPSARPGCARRTPARCATPRAAADSGRGDHDRRRRPPAAHAGPRHAASASG